MNFQTYFYFPRKNQNKENPLIPRVLFFLN
nr:MAG TPA: hypothetical protein [Caudoviricetes sp.]